MKSYPPGNSVSVPVKCKRGELYWVDWDPNRGSEQAGIRPALIIQNDIGNELSPTTIVASCSSATKRVFPFLVRVKSSESGLPKDCSINLSSIMTIDKSRLRDKCGELSREKMGEVDKALQISLQLAGSL
jgi:mRNA interferase MazF